jgi:hypothetical protein
MKGVTKIMKRLITIITLIGIVGAAVFMMACLGPATSGEVLETQKATSSVGDIGSESSTEPLSSDVGEDNGVDASASREMAETGSATEFIQVNSQESSADIRLDGYDVSVVGAGVTVDDQVITITSAGTYTIQGELANGRIVVDVGDDDDVTLVLDNAEIHCSTFSPIYVANADEVVILLASGTANVVEDGETYVLEAGVDEPDAAIFSHDELTITGSGSLTVIANYNDGIQSKDDLMIEGGDVTVIAANDGLKGRNSITVRDADITVDAGGDGLQSNGTEDETQGIILIESGTITIVADADGIQAATTLVINDGDVNLVTGGGSANSSTLSGWGSWSSQGASSTSAMTASAKGLKAGTSLTIAGGAIEIDSSDDAIHSNDTLVINGGEIVISSGDDGIHADTSLAINGGDITINKSYEGIESVAVSLNGGTVHVVASDDGINTAGGNDGSSLGGRPGQNVFNTSATCMLSINGGYLYVNAGGDGLDANGSITMTGGIVIVNGPTDSGNGALDYMGSFRISGGYLVAAGSVGMAEAPSSTSSQNSIMVNLSSSVSAGTLIHIESADGEDVVTFKAAKTWQSFVLSSPSLETGQTYDVYVGGSASGTSTDGLYSSGTYSSGTNVGSFTISNAVTTLGSTGGMGGQPTVGGRR